MKKTKTFYLSFAIILVILSLFFLDRSNTYLSFSQAYTVAQNELLRQNFVGDLIFATSANKEDRIDKLRNGKREFWNLIFAAPNSTEHLAIELDGKNILKTTKTRGHVISSDNFIKPDIIMSTVLRL